MRVAALGYLGFTTAKPLAEWARFATGILGASAEERDGALRVRVDERNFRVEVTRADTAGLSFVGWDVGNDRHLHELRQRLSAAGVDVRSGTAEECARRGVLELIACRDPAGNALELFYGQMCPREPFVSPLGVRFVTGELGLGHIVLRVGNYDAALRFYRELLGFDLTDVWAGDGGSAVFMHCNPRHHSLALRSGDSGSELIHFMLEVDDLDAVGLASERGRDLLSRTLGRHFNDQMLSCYFRTPSGFEVEYGTGGRKLDTNTWLAGQIDSPSGWGHQRLSISEASK